MNKKLNYVVLCFVAIIVASCTIAVYVQKNTSDSTQKIENPTSISADSASVSIKIPSK